MARVADFNEAIRKKYAAEMGDSSSLSILRQKRPDLPEWAEQDAFEAKVLNRNETVDMALKLVRPAPSGWLDRVLGAPVPPVNLPWRCQTSRREA